MKKELQSLERSPLMLQGPQTIQINVVDPGRMQNSAVEGPLTPRLLLSCHLGGSVTASYSVLLGSKG